MCIINAHFYFAVQRFSARVQKKSPPVTGRDVNANSTLLSNHERPTMGLSRNPASRPKQQINQDKTNNR